MADEHFHRLVPDEFETAHKEALRLYESHLVAALGTTHPWSEERDQAFRCAVEEAFNAGYRAGREVGL